MNLSRIILIFSIFLLVCSLSSAIYISEVEINPEGRDSGNEWVELYSDEWIQETYIIKNNDGDEIEIDLSFSGFYVYEFNKQWLDNSDEKVLLFKGDILIDETPILKDSDNDNKTWQLCSSWKFNFSTKKVENLCENSKKIYEQTENDKEEVIEEKSFDKEIDSQKSFIAPKNITLNSINLNPKTIKSDEDKEKKRLNKEQYAMYGFFVFCFLLGLLLIFKNKEYIEDEFRE